MPHLRPWHIIRFMSNSIQYFGRNTHYAAVPSDCVNSYSVGLEVGGYSRHPLPPRWRTGLARICLRHLRMGAVYGFYWRVFTCFSTCCPIGWVGRRAHSKTARSNGNTGYTSRSAPDFGARPALAKKHCTHRRTRLGHTG